MNVVIKKIKENDFKKNIASNDKYIWTKKQISANTRSQLKLLIWTFNLGSFFNSMCNMKKKHGC